ncbi:unnamed protein product [Dovyalis caffra]|uniref:Serine aminopeptidase S33 domain-containing protein n=1 Tax=Dovyalis caffra TaxID=77055 RepID=A0AAV1RWX6_9ROSI|nr:unnamed protein product [Dovyalis caffra]
MTMAVWSPDFTNAIKQPFNCVCAWRYNTALICSLGSCEGLNVPFPIQDMASVLSSWVLPYVFTNSEITPRFHVRVQSVSGGDSKGSPSDSTMVNGASLIREKEKHGVLIDGGIGEKEKTGGRIDAWNASLKCGVKKGCDKDVISNDLDVLWDDGYGTKTVMDYYEEAKEIIRPDGGLPGGIDGVGSALILHHKALGKVFEVRCLHIPVHDRTPFEGLVKFVEETVRLEHASSPNKPIYLVGDSFGGCLVLAIAARNPEIDLVVILANPGNPVKMARANIENRLPPRVQTEQLFQNLIALIPYLSPMVRHSYNSYFSFDASCRTYSNLQRQRLDLVDIIPKDTLIWKLKLLKSAASYTNSRLHAVKAEVLVLSSGNDYMLPSGDEAQRLKSSIENCTVRYFKDNGHTILLEDGVNLLTVIKGTGKYRRSRRIDFASDFVPPSISEFKYVYDIIGFLRFAIGSVMFSTLNDGKIVKGLHGVPNEGPVLLVGHHMLMGLELYSLVPEFLREKNIMVRCAMHPVVLRGRQKASSPEFSLADWMKVMGAVPVTASNLFELLSTKSHVLLYPGGAREALHHRSVIAAMGGRLLFSTSYIPPISDIEKFFGYQVTKTIRSGIQVSVVISLDSYRIGEEYKLIWPDQQEFVRMAVRFGATIVPFGTVGEDDIAELVLDYNDLMKIPVVNDYIRDTNRNSTRIRDKSKGEVANQELYLPGILPKVPGRFYFLFGKPIETKGRKEILKDRENANQLYLHDLKSVPSFLIAMKVPSRSVGESSSELYAIVCE